MRRIKLIIEYDGSAYHGWQYQDNAVTVQEELRDAIEGLTGVSTIPEGAGRTDAGVHAYGQVACFNTTSSIPPARFAAALNSFLPHDISIVSSEEVDNNFHARFSAIRKHYRYIIINRQHKSALWANKAWHIRDKLNFDAMNEAAKYLIGHHSFKAFCASGHSTKTFNRTILKSEWCRDGDFLTFDTCGDGFLYNMVRIMVGTMVDIGRDRLSPSTIKQAIIEGDRNDLGVTAPPSGLYLMEVSY